MCFHIAYVLYGFPYSIFKETVHDILFSTDPVRWLWCGDSIFHWPCVLHVLKPFVRFSSIILYTSVLYPEYIDQQPVMPRRIVYASTDETFASFHHYLRYCNVVKVLWSVDQAPSYGPDFALLAPLSPKMIHVSM